MLSFRPMLFVILFAPFLRNSAFLFHHQMMILGSRYSADSWRNILPCEINRRDIRVVLNLSSVGCHLIDSVQTISPRVPVHSLREGLIRSIIVMIVSLRGVRWDILCSQPIELSLIKLLSGFVLFPPTRIIHQLSKNK